jgi:hypothetical protein
VELSVDDSDVINDDDRHAHIVRQVPQWPNIGVKAASRATNANDRKVFCNPHWLHRTESSRRQATLRGGAHKGGHLGKVDVCLD